MLRIHEILHVAALAITCGCCVGQNSITVVILSEAKDLTDMV